MANEDFEALLESVREGGAILRGEIQPTRRFVVSTPNVSRIRQEFGLSRTKFAQVMGVSARTVEGWEQGRRQPTGAARMFLLVAAKHPEIVVNTISEALGR
ncbi:MAG: helix-turn-helix domain-containing protein [Pleurocapsa sp. SU_196_0]|nr:helix-turn-helix domain-containing protein [Pleurocapsa sp. SU_196_0]